MFRTRFKQDIIAEFVDPSRPQKKQKLIMLCDGMPSMPSKQPLAEFLATKGFWVIYPRYHGAWESGGEFLEVSARTSSTSSTNYPLNLRKLLSVGASSWRRMKSLPSGEGSAERRQFFCLWIDESHEWWQIVRLWIGAFWIRLRKRKPQRRTAEYIREAFGNGYRLSDANWDKLRGGAFYNPWHHRTEIDASKVLMFHTKDDPNMLTSGPSNLRRSQASSSRRLPRGGHISTDYITRKYWPQIKRFFDSARG